MLNFSIISSPFEAKFRHVKISNNTIKSKVMVLKYIEQVLEKLGYVKESEEMYTLKDDNLGEFMEGAPAVEYRRRLVAARLTSQAAYEKELTLIKEKKAQQMQEALRKQEAQRLKDQCNYDKMERKHMKVDNSKSNNLNFGTKTTTYKDIGVDLCAKKKGG